MGSPLGPVIANIFMSELETLLVPTLSDSVLIWFRYVDDTFTVMKDGQIENVKAILNNFHHKINFTHDMENENCLPFLDVLVERNLDGSVKTSVYRKRTDTNIYIHWKAHAPKIWKIGTLKGLFRRAFIVSSDQEKLNSEISFLKDVFTKTNGYPTKVVKNVLKSVREQFERTNDDNVAGVENANPQSSQTVDVPTHPYMVLPYKGDKGERKLSVLKKALSKVLPKTVIPRFTYKGKKLGEFFPVKDRIEKKHLNGIVYAFNIPTLGNNAYHYIGETKVRCETRFFQHAETDKKSAVYLHSQRNGYYADSDNFSILDKNYKKYLDRKICEALYVKDHKPFLNVQKKSHKLELFT